MSKVPAEENWKCSSCGWFNYRENDACNYCGASTISIRQVLRDRFSAAPVSEQAQRAAEKIDEHVEWDIEAAEYKFPDIDTIAAIIEAEFMESPSLPDTPLDSSLDYKQLD